VLPQPDAFTGENSAAKRTRIAAAVTAKGADVALITAPDPIARLLNVRGGECAAHAVRAGLRAGAWRRPCRSLMDRRKVPARTLGWLGNAVTPAPPDELGLALDMLGRLNKRVLIETATAPMGSEPPAGGWRHRGARRRPGGPAQGVQNAVELDGIRRAHRRDGAAVSRFLAWLARESSSGRLREIEASDRLQALRQETGKLRDLSFDTISGAGPQWRHRALPRLGGASARSSRAASIWSIQGGQYRDGTTDITRTVAIGTPSGEMRDRFTRVLKGHIALAMARFPAGTTGSQVDALARYALWQAGLDYDHGTGHGVGAYLAVKARSASPRRPTPSPCSPA
jgi:Xaa-Pro aminopeptidase